MDPTEGLQYRDPRGIDGSTEDVLDETIEQIDAFLELLGRRGGADIIWATRNALMTDATELTALDKVERDPLGYAQESREAALVTRFRGAIGTARRLLDELRAQREIPLSERDPLSLSGVVAPVPTEATLPEPPKAE